MDVRPDGFHQFLLAQDAAGILGEQPSISNVLGRSLIVPPSGRRSSARSGSSSKPEKRSTVPSNRQRSPFSAGIDPKNVPNRTGSPNIRKISECLNRGFRTPPPLQCDVADAH
jgi:hypothetical protein